ncbi:hypothetical protein M404DRAFT_651290 [Pisolithus tinctorius Marx 270]|uniref:Uncharacterized protein n=1 Tax=Pisolithus tinctorius Marx 270 TaxID=870435 RepID=A0A0C3P5F8_PISTI|nr:hypothetical protein M404DRAFT_651290 [Pisolithus tinctorius Marx 270]
MSLLASVSLFALVLGRPILPGTELDVQSFPEVGQTAFQIGAGKDAYRDDTALPSTGEPVVSLKEPSTLEHTEGGSRSGPFMVSDEQIGELDVGHSSEGLSNSIHAPTNTSASVGRSPISKSDQRQPTFSLLVLVLSCVAAFLALACIMLVLYITKFLVSHVVASRNAWELLPHFQNSIPAAWWKSAVCMMKKPPKMLIRQTLIRMGMTSKSIKTPWI